VDDLRRGVLDDAREDPDRDLLGHDQALAVGPDLGQKAGEQLDRLRRRTWALAAPKQPVRLLDAVRWESRTGSPGGRRLSGGGRARPGARSPFLSGTPCPVVADLLDLQHYVAAEQRSQIQGMAALEETARGPQPQAVLPPPGAGSAPGPTRAPHSCG
jgi:hypothetical protein